MKTAGAIVLVAVALLPVPALACTMIWTPLGDRLDQLSPGEIAVRADASLIQDIWSDEHRRGTLTLNVRHCLRIQPRGPCPTRLTVTFDEREVGTCPSAIFQLTEREVPRLRYFVLRHEADGTWLLRSADRSLWGRG